MTSGEVLELDPLSLDAVLASYKGINSFIAFCTEVGYFLKISFWLHVEQMKMARSSPESAFLLAESIYRRYFSSASHVAIEFPLSVLARILKNVEKMLATNGSLPHPLPLV